MYSGLESVLIAVVVIVGYVIIRIKSEKKGAKEEYERVAGKILKAGDSVPKWIPNELWESIGIISLKTRRGHHHRDVLVCQTVVMAGVPQNICIEILLNQRLPQSGETFDISETGELEFNRQPNL